jgi:ATP synthase I subunit
VSTADLFRRLERDTVLVVVALATGSVLVRPHDWRLSLGVVGGGVLAATAYWAIRGAVEGLSDDAISRENTRKIRRSALVKFFTRHAILALAGYGMMARLQLHPVGMLLGVTAPAIAAAIEAAIGRRTRRS